MGRRTPVVCWDTCVFIDAHQQTTKRIEDILEVERHAKAQKIRIVCSAMAVAECVKLCKDAPPTDEEIQQIRDYFDRSWVTVIPVDRPVAKRAADLVRQHDLKPPDAIHLATALRQPDVQCLMTYDASSGLLELDKKIESLRIIPASRYHEITGEGELYQRDEQEA